MINVGLLLTMSSILRHRIEVFNCFKLTVICEALKTI